MPNEQDIIDELLSIAPEERGAMMDLSDRDDLDPMTVVEIRTRLTSLRNRIDTVSRSLAADWYERHGESGFVDPETGVIGYVAPRSGPYQIEDGDGFAEYLRGLSNEEMIKVIASIRVSGIPDPVRKATLSQKIGTPLLTVTNTDNPKAPKWITRAEEGTLVKRH
jgi:hypothetical protein